MFVSLTNDKNTAKELTDGKKTVGWEIWPYLSKKDTQTPSKNKRMNSYFARLNKPLTGS